MKFTSVLCGLAAGASWEYPEVGGTWGDSCTDQARGSPIDLDYTYKNFNFGYLHTDSIDNDLFKLTGYDQDIKWQFVDNGHSVVFLPQNDEEIFFEGGKLENKYHFHSLHFHWGDGSLQGGSEHTFNGRHHFAEVHLVHYGDHCGAVGGIMDCIAPEGAPPPGDGLAVLGFFIELDENVHDNDVNESLKFMLRKSVAFDQDGAEASELPLKSSLSDFIGGIDMNAFYRYEGSLTTPGCSEVVQWTVFKDTLKVNKRWAKYFVKSVGYGNHHLVDNYRGVQEMRDREVTFYSPDPGMALFYD